MNKERNMEKTTMFIDGNFPSRVGDCLFHCSPTCHPAQIGPEWQYGCTHKAWPANRAHDFVPIVFCGGMVEQCELRGKRFASYYKRGLSARLKNAKRRVEELEKEISDYTNIIANIKEGQK